MVFQDYALFPHLTVADNIAFGLHGARPAASARARVDELLEASAWATSGRKLSARALRAASSSAWRWRARWRRGRTSCCSTSRSPISTSTCASAWRSEVRDLLKRTARPRSSSRTTSTRRSQSPTRSASCTSGRIEQWDSAYNLYHRPATRFVADFVGQGVFLPGGVHRADVESSSAS